MVQQSQILDFQVVPFGRGVAGANRNDQELVHSCLPLNVIRRGRGHLERHEGGVVVGGHATVNKNEGVLLIRPLREPDNLWREEGRSGGAGSHQLPKW